MIKHLTRIAAGADFIYAERFGPFEACKEKGIYGFGHFVDQNSLTPEVVVSSAIALWDPSIKYLIDAWWNHVTKGVPYDAPLKDIIFGMADGGSALAPYHGLAEKIPAVATEPDETNATASELGEVIDGRDLELQGYEAKLAGAVIRDNPHLNPDGFANGNQPAQEWGRGYAAAAAELDKAHAVGRSDHSEGKAIDASPYPVDRIAFRVAWRDGWNEGAKIEQARQVVVAMSEPKPDEPDRVTITLDDLELVSLPDGTRDVWAKLPDGGKRKIGTSTDPALVPYVAAFDDRAKAMRPTPTPAQIPTIPGNLDALGALGRALEAMADAGYECELTIRVGGAA